MMFGLFQKRTDDSPTRLITLASEELIPKVIRRFHKVKLEKSDADLPSVESCLEMERSWVKTKIYGSQMSRWIDTSGNPFVPEEFTSNAFTRMAINQELLSDAMLSMWWLTEFGVIRDAKALPVKGCPDIPCEFEIEFPVSFDIPCSEEMRESMAASYGQMMAHSIIIQPYVECWMEHRNASLKKAGFEIPSSPNVSSNIH